MDKEARRIRKAVEALGERRPNEPYPEDIRHAVVAYAGRQRRRGRSWEWIGQQLRMSGSSVDRWYGQRPPAPLPTSSSQTSRPPASPSVSEPPPVLVPVQVQAEVEPEPADSGLVLVSPRGFRLLGLRLPEAAQLLEALS